MVVGFPVGGEQFAAESEFLRLTAIAEVEQCCVQQLRINVSGFPCDIEISGEFLIVSGFPELGASLVVASFGVDWFPGVGSLVARLLREFPPADSRWAGMAGSCLSAPRRRPGGSLCRSSARRNVRREFCGFALLVVLWQQFVHTL